MEQVQEGGNAMWNLESRDNWQLVLLLDGVVKNCPFCGKRSVVVSMVFLNAEKGTENWKIGCNEDYKCPGYDLMFFNMPLAEAVKRFNQREGKNNG
jgi:hypothetical protein